MSRSEELFNMAKKYIPGGVNSPVRAFGSVGDSPVFIESASGCRVRDADGKEYIDCVSSWGPLILGHAHPEVVAAVCDAAKGGTSFGAPTEGETRLAELICEMVPGVDKVRLVNSGTEATMSAVRLARGFTGRDKIIKFEGCYHGHSDSFLIKAGSGALTLGTPSSPGVPESLAGDTINAVYNDLESVRSVFERMPEEIACIIVEPVAGNMGVVLPAEGFLASLRELAVEFGALLIFDEVITGFRLAPGGAQEYYGIKPDLTTLGKIIGGGLPVGAFGGRADIMDRMAPDGPVYQAGTLSGNPVAMIAGLTTLQLLKAKKKSFASLDKKTDQLCRAMHEMFFKKGIPVCINRVFSMFTVFFQEGPVVDLQTALKSDTNMFARFFRGMLKNGIWLAPSQYEAGFLSFAHTEKDLQKTLQACAKTLRNL